MKRFFKRLLVCLPFCIAVNFAILAWVVLGDDNIDIPLIYDLLEWSKK